MSLIKYFKSLKTSVRYVLSRMLAFALGYRIVLPKVSAVTKPTFGQQPIYDLANFKISNEGCAIELRAFPFGAPFSEYEPSIAAVTLKGRALQHYTSVFSTPLLLSAYSQRKKKRVEVNDPVYLLPYNTNHFGHFTGECLGALIYFSSKLKENGRKLQLVAPSMLHATLYKYGNADNLNALDPLTLSQNNILFTDAILLPRLAPWQNLALCSEIFCALPCISQDRHKIFLTSERADRISNIATLKKYLIEKGFYILNPRDHDFLDTLALVQNADILLTESGSIMLNILISRFKPYHCLLSEKATEMSSEDFIGGGIFNTFKLYNASIHYCKSIGTLGRHHPYSNQIEVDLSKLQIEMNL